MSEFEDLENPCFKDQDQDIDYVLKDIILDYNNFNISNNGAISGTIGSTITGAQGLGIGHSGFYGPQGSSFSTYSPYNYSYGANGSGGCGTITFNSDITSAFKVNGDAEFEGDVKIKGVSITELFSSIEKRLAILTPDPKKLEHFEALKKAYEQYKTLEALCELPTEDKEK